MAEQKSISGMGGAYLRIARYFAPELRRFSWLLTAASLLLVLEVLFRLLEPWPLKFIFDAIIVGPDSQGNLQTLIIVSSVAILLFALFRAFCAYGHTIAFALSGNRIMTRIRNDLYDHIQCLPLEYHNKSRVGDLIVRVVGDMALLQEVTVTALMPLLGNILIMIGMFAVMLWMNWVLALTALCVLPLFLLTNIKLGGSIQHASKKQRRTESQMATTAAETFTGIRTVQALSLEDKMSQQFASSSERSLKEGVTIKRLSAKLERIVDVLVAIALALVVALGANLVLKNNITPGDLIVFITYLKAAYKPIRNFAKYTARLSKATAAGDRIIELFEIAPGIRQQKTGKKISLNGEIQISGLSFSYDKERPALHQIDLHVRAGQRIAIVGPSGSGKSTLISLLLGLYLPNEGQITYNSISLDDLDITHLRRHLSVVLQDTLLFATSIGDNITFGEESVDIDRVIEACKTANIYDFIQTLPDGLDSIVGERGVNFSTGQRQRLALARAIVRKSPVIILDEPTTGLDAENVSAFNHALKNLPDHSTLILVTHDLEQAKLCEKIVVMREGRLEQSGTHDELVALDGLYQKLVTSRNRDQAHG